MEIHQCIQFYVAISKAERPTTDDDNDDDNSRQMPLAFACAHFWRSQMS